MTATIAHFINGQDEFGNGTRSTEVFNPASGSVTGRVALADKGDVEAAIASAQAAFPAWAATTRLARSRVMFKFRQLLETHHRPAQMSADETPDAPALAPGAHGQGRGDDPVPCLLDGAPDNALDPAALPGMQPRRSPENLEALAQRALAEGDSTSPREFLKQLENREQPNP